MKLVVDEWGTWHKPGHEADPSHRSASSRTLRDALVAGLTLDIFHRHADKVGMANIAQLVNCLQSLFCRARGPVRRRRRTTMCSTCTRRTSAAESVRTVFSAPSVGYDRNGQPARIWGLNGSASRKDKMVTLTVVNPSPDTPREADIGVAGARIVSCATRTLTASTLDAHNSFAEPNAVASPPSVTQTVPSGGLVLTFPKASVTAVTLTLA